MQVHYFLFFSVGHRITPVTDTFIFGQMYSDEFKGTTESKTSASFMDLLLSIEIFGQFYTCLYDKSGDITSTLHISVPAKQYSIFASFNMAFYFRRLSNKLLNEGYVMERLKS